ncbi:MAG TPA: serine hydroxymethyltransferase [Planctomycetes bacterium]|nr:serine hydroxymethyltransferase [Planctomycetota bacterium]HIK62182.1 serine hydroxymethyltransferase [Planctomycetota bacterium]
MTEPSPKSNLARFVEAAVHRLEQVDPELSTILENEYRRQSNVLTMVASSSIADPSALICEAMTSMNVTAEGYPGRRFHAGCRHIDEIEQLAIDRVKAVFGAQFANVQPMTASSANEVVMFSTLKPGDTLLGMDLDSGGHLTHGSKASISGQVFNAVGYGLDSNERLDYDQAHALAIEHKPKLIICGTTAYAREIDWARFRAIADEVGAYVLADITHIAGLVAAGIHSNPIDHAHFTTTCTHKQLFGGRGGLIMIGKDHDQPAHDEPDKTLAQVIQNRVFPYFQGAPNQSSIAAKARGMGFVGSEEFKAVARRIVDLSQALAAAFVDKGYRVITGGTDNHIVVVDVMQKGITGVNAEKALEDCGLVVNKNRIPFDKKSPFVTSGIRLGTNGLAIREMEPGDMVDCVEVIHDVLSHLEQSGDKEYRVDPGAAARAEAEVARLCALRPIRTYPPLQG